jgi:Ca-activated chloride channel family protein
MKDISPNPYRRRDVTARLPLSPNSGKGGLKKFLIGFGIIPLIFVLVSCAANPAERNNEANRLSANGQYEEAANVYHVAQVLAPDNAVIYFNSASALAAKQDFEAAEAALQQAIARGDASLAADAWYNLGNLYFGVGDVPNAVNAYREALRLNPNHENARYNLEVANAQAFVPTPTSVEMQQQMENQNVNPTATPSPNPSGQEPPTPTPTPPDVIPPVGPSPMNIGDDDEGDMSLEPQSSAVPRPDGEMDVETAIDMLEPVEASQERISTFRENYNQTGEQDTENDW